MSSREIRDRHFTQEEVGELIETASRLQSATDAERLRLREGLTYDQVVQIASELGVSEDDVVRAIGTANLGGSMATAPRRDKARRSYRRAVARFKATLVTWIGVSGGLAIIDAVADPTGLDWVWYPMAGMGIAVAIRGGRVIAAKQGLDEVS